MWLAECHLCFCYSGNGFEHGTVMCSLLKCPNLKNCSNPRYIDGSCCPICTDSSQTEFGLLPSNAMSEDSSLALVSRMNSHAEWTMPCSDVGLVLGEVWTPEGSLNDECAICGCMASFIMCSYHVCPPLTCKTPVRIPGSCCPSCPDIEHITKREKSCLTEEGIMTNSGDSWAVNKCMTCICIDGRITCKSKSCFLKGKGFIRQAQIWGVRPYKIHWRSLNDMKP